jgi:hypothetical protein
MESMNYGNPPSKNIEAAAAEIAKHDVNELVVTWKKGDQRNYFIYGQMPPENAIGENEFSQTQMPPALTFTVQPVQLLGGKSQSEQDSIIINKFKMIIEIGKMMEANKIVYQTTPYEKEIAAKVKARQPIDIVNIHKEMLKNELR